jgi:hypothetical protein
MDDDQITIQAQVVKAQTTSDGALRVYMDVFGSDSRQIAYMTLLAHDQAVIEFEPRIQDAKKG